MPPYLKGIVVPLLANASVLCTKEKNVLINFVSDATERFVLFCFALLCLVFAFGMPRYKS